MKKLYYILAMLGILCAGISFSQDASAATVTDSALDDNTTATANRVDIGDTILGTISETDDLDYYVFCLDGAGCVTLKMTSYMPVYGIKVFDIDGKEIWASTWNWWTEDIGYRRDIHKLYLEKGIYYIKVFNDDRHGDGGKGTYEYECATEFVLSNVNNVESDNTFSTANDVAMGDVVVGQISENDDHDTFSFELPEVGCVSLSMTSYMKYYKMYVYDTDGEEIWNSGINEWTESVGYRRDAYQLYLEKGKYYIKVSGEGYNYSASTGKYVVDTQFVPSDTSFLEDDNSFAAANMIAQEKTYIGQISINDDFDTYQFNIASGEKISINITSYMRYYGISLYNVNGEEIWSTYNNEWNKNVGYRKDTYDIVFSPGIYYMQINCIGWHDGEFQKAGTGKYQFSLNSVDTKKPDDNPSDPTDVDKPVETPSDPAEIKRPVKTPSNTVKKPGRVSRVRIYKRKKSLYLSWNPVSKASGYQICYSTSKTFKGKKTVTVSSYYTILGKLKAKKKYYVKVRAYTYSNGKKVYGAYSKVVEQKTL